MLFLFVLWFHVGTDPNFTMAAASACSDGPLGYFELNHVNESGKRFLSYFSMSNLAVITSFFKKNQYAKWIYPHSKKTHQIDLFIVNKEMIHYRLDAGITSQLLDSKGDEIFKKKNWTRPTYSKPQSPKIVKSRDQKEFMWRNDEKYQLQL